MLVIRDAQLKSLGEALAREFGVRTLRALQAWHPREAEALGARFEETVRGALKQAGTLGLTRADEQELFARCVLVFGAPPWDTPWGRTLARDDLPLEVAAARFATEAREALAGTGHGGGGV